MLFAKQSTARTVTVGPVLDASGVAVTDGVVGDFKISKNGGAPAALNGSATLTHRSVGFYSLALTASDLDTVGTAEVVIDDTTNACPMKELEVVETTIYDALFADTANGFTGAAGSSGVNVNAWLGTAPATPTVAGVPEVDVTHINGNADAGIGLTSAGQGYFDSGMFDSNVLSYLGTTLTEGAAGRLAGGMVKFFNVASPTGTVNSLPDAVAGAAGGVHILGDNVGATTYTGVASPAITYTGASAHPGTRYVGTGTSAGFVVLGGATASAAASFTGQGSKASGILAVAGGAGYGIQAQGGTTGVGLQIQGGTTSGAAMTLSNTSGDVLTITGSSTIGATTLASITVSGATTLTSGLSVGGSMSIGNFVQTGTASWGAFTVTDFTNFGDTVYVGTITATDADNDVRGIRLGSSGLDAISATAPTSVASTFREKILQVWERFFGKFVADSNTTSLKLMQGTGSTPQTTQSYTSAAGIDTINRAT